MDGPRFDRWTRALASGSSRRRLLQGVTGGALAALLAHLGLEEASAACVKVGQRGCRGPQNKTCCPGATCQGGSKRRVGRCACKAGLTKCGTTCVNTTTDGQHCGGCNNPCGTGETCQGGTCVGGGGECSPSCAGGQTCRDGGICACPAGTESSCDFAWPPGCYCCPVGQFHCGDGACHECCIGANCGGGGRECGEGNTCRCPNLQQDCGGICQTCCTDEHCANYNMSPGDGFICTDPDNPHKATCRCQNGMVEPCSDGTKKYCRDVVNDNDNCGACHRKCIGGWNCVNTVCMPP